MTILYIMLVIYICCIDILMIINISNYNTSISYTHTNISHPLAGVSVPGTWLTPSRLPSPLHHGRSRRPSRRYRADPWRCGCRTLCHGQVPWSSYMGFIWYSYALIIMGYYGFIWIYWIYWVYWVKWVPSGYLT